MFIDQAIELRDPTFHVLPASLRVYKYERFGQIMSAVKFHHSFEIIFSNSVIRYTSRVNYDVACQMDFHTYPSDVQRCHIKLESFGHTQDQMQVPNFTQVRRS